MEYAVGNVGRVVVIRLSEGDGLYECVESVAAKENIRSASVFITGGFRRGQIVVGPEQEKPKIIPKFRQFEGPGEVLGVGTIYCDEEGPRMHIHTAVGKEDEVIVGCPRGVVSTFLVLEITIIEIAGVDAVREMDAGSGLKLLKIR